jgi:hypothetical protein
VEVVPRCRSKPYEIGNGSLLVQQDVLFHILADKRRTRNDLATMLLLQNDKSIYLFDDNKITKEKIFPLNYRGEKVNNLVYSDFVSPTGYRSKICRFTNCMSTEGQMLYRGLYDGAVRATLEFVFADM